MPFLGLEIVGAIAGFTFLFQFGLRKPTTVSVWVIDFANVGIMVGFIGLGVLAYVLAPSILTTVYVVGFYSPHPYALIFYAVASLVVLRPRFRPEHFLLSFALVYGLEELMWNGVAYVRYLKEPSVIAFMSGSDWLLFLGVVLVAVGTGYYFVRPKLVLNPIMPVVPLFLLIWAWPAGFPVMANEYIATAPTSYVYSALAWELMWALLFWLFVWASVRPHEGYRTA